MKEMVISRPDRGRLHGWRIRRATAMFVVVAVVMAGTVWLAISFAPGHLAPFLVPAAIALATAMYLTVLRPRGGDKTGDDLSALRHAGEVIYHANEGIVTISARGLVLDMNPAAEKLFGYHKAEVAGRPISLLLTEAPSQERPNLLRESLPAGSILGLAAGAREVIGLRKSGETFPLELTGNSVLVGEESVSVAFVRDVSKRKRAQRYLLAHYTATCILAEAGSVAEAMPRILQALGEALQWDMVVYWKVDSGAEPICRRQEFWTPASGPVRSEAGPVCQRGEGLPGRVWATAQPAWCDDLIAQKDTTTLPDGSGLFYGAFGFPILVGNDVCGVLMIASCRPQKRDEQLLGVMAELGKQLGHFVTRKLQEEELRETSQTLQSLVRAAPVAIHIVDLVGNVRLWNPAAERIFGWPAAEVLGRPLPPLQLRQQGETDPAAASSLVGDRDVATSMRSQRKNGEAIEVSLSTAPLKDAAGNVVGMLGIGMDLTAQRSLENQLRQAQKMEAVGQLAGGIAHDFNNLVTIINGYCDFLLMAENLNGLAREYLTEIHQAGERAAGLTRQLLAFSRKEIVQPRLLNLNETVVNVQLMLRRLIGEDIQLFTSLDRVLGRVCADPGQIEQVLVNLAVNARDAMPSGGKLTVETRAVSVGAGDSSAVPELAPGRYARLSVRDTGCGMDASTLARVFEPFFTTKEVGKGSGLGLATVYGIVKQSGGHVRAISEVGKGTTFEVYLPIAEEASADGQTDEGATPTRVARAGQETVLLAEDEGGVRSLARRVLQGKGYTVLEANNGEEALRLLERNAGAIDLLLTDVVMPHMGGRAAAEAVASHYPSVRVLYMSGYTDDEILRNGVMRSDKYFLSKPFSPTELLQKVREVLDGER